MMVTRWGFSPELGAVSYGENQDEVFLGMSVARQQNISEATAMKIDSEVRRLVEAGHEEARQVLEAKRSDLEVLAKGLLEFETLSGDRLSICSWQEAESRIHDRAVDAALLRRAERRSRSAAPRCRGPMEPQPQA